MKSEKPLSPEEQRILMQTLQRRFEQNEKRHKGMHWADVQKRLEHQPQKLWSLQEMERTGGEPDVVFWDEAGKQYGFCDCSAETPAGRRSLCYDRAGWESRKEARPTGNAIDVAAEMGIELLTEEQYSNLQESGNFDIKTSSWLQASATLRKAGGAIFGDRRYGRVFVYHNGPQSYYAGRGFRGLLWV